MKKNLISNTFKKKSQAAVEFLITYGWAILGVMVTVGALAYFGVFNTDRFINDECNFGSQLYCEDFILTSNGKLEVQIRNNFGQEIVLGGAKITHEGVALGGAIPCNPVLPIPPGELSSTSCDLRTAFSQNEKIKLNVLIQFKRNDINAPWHNVTGTIVATAQQP